MEELRAVGLQADKLDRELEILQQMREMAVVEESALDHVKVMLQQAKRVRRDSNLLVRALAQYRDTLQSKEDTR